MDQIPSIVLNKIYWYLWHNTNKELCHEINRKMYAINDRQGYCGSKFDYKLKPYEKKTAYWFKLPWINYREWDNLHVLCNSNMNVNNVKGYIVAPLPKNYFYIPLKSLKFD